MATKTPSVWIVKLSVCTVAILLFWNNKRGMDLRSSFIYSLLWPSNPTHFTLTCPCRRISLAPLRVQWQRCHRHCASARSPWWARPSCLWWRRGRRGQWSPAGQSARRRTHWSTPRWSSPGKPAEDITALQCFFILAFSVWVHVFTSPHLKGVLGHARKAVIRCPGGDGANAELADLIGLTKLGHAFRLYYTHQAWEDETHTRLTLLKCLCLF